MDRPRPEPPPLPRVRLESARYSRSNTRAACADGTPGPSSDTSRTASGTPAAVVTGPDRTGGSVTGSVASRPTRTVTQALGGVCRSALATRFVAT
jgi:hypothetical protein